MNRPKEFKTSKINDQIIVDFLNETGHHAEIATIDDDKKNKYDIIVDGKKIDTKYFSRLYYEVDKHYHSSADKLWYILKGTNHSKTYLINKDALKMMCDDITGIPTVEFQQGSESGQRLANFTIDMLDPTSYEIIDLSDLHLV